MSDIPDWLVELASQRDADEDEGEEVTPPSPEVAETDADEVTTEWDFLRTPPAVAEEAAPSSRWDGDAGGTGKALSTPAAARHVAALDEGEVIESLRGEVDAEALALAPVAVAVRTSSPPLIPGLLPWQQAVLAILLLLDIAVIGLLFLVMLGKMSIG